MVVWLRPGGAGTLAPLAHTAVIDQINFWDRDLPFPESYPKIGHNGTASAQFWSGPDGPVAAGELVMHPGSLGAVLRFTAPASAVYTVFVQARATASCSSATHVSVRSGGAQLDGAALADWVVACGVNRKDAYAFLFRK